MVAAKRRTLKISNRAHKAVLALPEELRSRVKDAVARLAAGDTQGLDIKPLAPYPDEFRLRVGRVRILFRLEDELLFIFKAGFRGDVYK